MNNKTAIKISASAVVIAALCLWIWQSIGDLPTALKGAAFAKVSAIAHIALIIHAIESLIAATLTFQTAHSSKATKAIKASLYVFLVGTVGLSEIIQTQKEKESTP